MRAERVSQADARREVVPASRSQRARNVRITREYPSQGRSGEDDGLFAANQSLNFVVFFPPRSTHVITQANIESEIGFCPPTVLPVETQVPTASVRRIRLPLYELGGGAQKEIHNVAAGLAGLAAKV